MAMIFKNVNPILMRASLNEWIVFFFTFVAMMHFVYTLRSHVFETIKFDNMALKWSSAWLKLKQLYGTAIKIWMNEWAHENK